MAGTLQKLKKHFGWNKVIGCSVTKANGAMSLFTLRTCSHHGLKAVMESLIEGSNESYYTRMAKVWKSHGRR
jgi:hypothetical protein